MIRAGFQGVVSCALPALALGLVAWGPPAPGPTAPAELTGLRPIFVAGEQITWQVKLLGVDGGRARMAVGGLGTLAGRRVVAAVFEVESSGVLATVKDHRERVSSWIDAATGIPRHTQNETRDGGKLLVVDATRERAGAQLVIRRAGGAEEKRQQPLPLVATHDPVSAIFLLRSWRAPVGSRGRYHHLDGDRLWVTDVVVQAKETIGLAEGRRAAIRVSGISRGLTASLGDDLDTKPRPFTFWFSDDAERVPLRLVATTAFGKLEMRLSSYANPATQARGK